MCLNTPIGVDFIDHDNQKNLQKIVLSMSVCTVFSPNLTYNDQSEVF
ncbi:hypothetical protein HMP0015_2717 [Acinetobacter haemolyticus ATCC 19194]|uniref:Uncharacterized protein n=1 Tax=Acinetobacter haemolyticus ATCC 19194 TaxID=707232 RepID=D4XSM5_ACIHA|nr:hypothetical protein HMP0015_2717 [Acinetobacter haemolyticus ATCC 19194]